MPPASVSSSLPSVGYLTSSTKFELVAHSRVARSKAARSSTAVPVEQGSWPLRAGTREAAAPARGGANHCCCRPSSSFADLD